MKNRLMILTVLCFGLGHGAWSQVPGDGRQQNQPALSKQNNTKPIQPYPPAIQVQEGTAKQEQYADPKPADYPWRELYAPANVPNWFLVSVGFWAGLMALRTLKSIDRQADQMEGQLREMQKVSDIENKTLILQYRPRVIIRNTVTKDFSVSIGDLIKYTLAFQLVNTGGSPAYIIRGEMSLLAVSAHGVGDIRFVEGTQDLIDARILQPGQRENFEDVLDSTIIADAEWSNFHEGKASIHSVYLLGTIWYRDDLSIPRATGIHRKYDPENRRFVAQKDNEEEYSD